MASKWVKGAFGVVGVVVVVAGGGFAWGTSATKATLAVVHETHRVDLPMPWPLSDEEVATLRAERAAASAPADSVLAAVSGVSADAAEPVADPLAGVDLDAIARERGVARGKHLIEARFACVECHGQNLAGGTMIDDPAIGRLLGPNLTTGEGSRTAAYTMADWDRTVRHGVKPDGTAAVMPAEDFVSMSDQELVDVVTYIRAQPAVDATVPAPTFGPVGTMLVATGKMVLAADRLKDHQRAHAALPPATEANVEFGSHMAQICTGCHRTDLSGGPITAGDPAWPPARNLTPHEQGLKGWTYEQFLAALREGKRPDGTLLKAPMSLMAPYAKNMTDTELQALWAYLQSLPGKSTGA